VLKKIILSSILCLLPTSFCHASGITVTPAYQEITASAAAQVSYTNTNPEALTLIFSVQKIIATDLLGRLQFNAPLPQTLQNTDPEIAIINPNELIINPGETATISATFDSSKLNPGTTAFLLLAKINTPSISPPKIGRDEVGVSSTSLTQYLGSTILVNALGGHHTELTLLQTSISSFPLKFSHPDYLQLTIKNSGNTRSIPRGPLFITDQFGREVYRGAINHDSAGILPGGQRIIYGRLQPSNWGLPISLNRFELTLSDDVSATPILHRKYYLYLHPIFASGIILLFCLLYFFKKRTKSRYNQK
jgi:hypothetical protein